MCLVFVSNSWEFEWLNIEFEVSRGLLGSNQVQEPAVPQMG